MAANVQVILARDVPNLGRVGEICSVRPGFARNYLVPQGLALPASEKKVAEFEHKKRVVEHTRAKLKAASEARAQEMSGVQVTLTARVGEQGKLFGSITSRDISLALKAAGHDVPHRDIKLDGPLKSVGLHVLDVRLEADVMTQIKVVVAAEEVEEEEAAEEEAVEAASEDAGELDVEAEEAALQAAEGEATEAEATEAETPEA
jgi:large subunit ribosomal protein L9